jgi:N-acetylmuramoyl-L-alanine amidase
MLKDQSRTPRFFRRGFARSSMRPIDIIQTPSPNFNDRKTAIQYIVLHYTGMNNADAALRVLSDPQPVRSRYLNDIPQAPKLPDGTTAPQQELTAVMNQVSSHYLVYEDGRVFQLVDEAKRAWHAGGGSWNGQTDLNSASIGIEIANGGDDYGLPDFEEVQIQSVMTLVSEIMQRHGLKPEHVIGHSDLAPARKGDPGEKFPWKRLAEAGLSIWPAPAPEDGDRRILFDTIGQADPGVAAVQTGLGTIGYGIVVTGVYDDATRIVLRAFQRRFRPAQVDGKIDVETLSLIGRVVNILRPVA